MTTILVGVPRFRHLLKPARLLRLKKTEFQRFWLKAQPLNSSVSDSKPRPQSHHSLLTTDGIFLGRRNSSSLKGSLLTRAMNCSLQTNHSPICVPPSLRSVLQTFTERVQAKGIIFPFSICFAQTSVLHVNVKSQHNLEMGLFILKRVNSSFVTEKQKKGGKIKMLQLW